MSWFTEFLADTARQAAPGIHQAINSDIQRKQRLDEMRQQIPILVEQQKALSPGNVAEKQAAWENALKTALFQHRLNIERDRLKEEAKAANKGPAGDTDLLSFLKAKVETPQDPAVMPVAAGSPGYGVGEEAASGAVPPTRTRNAPDVFMETIGLNPAEREAVPSMTSEGKWGLSFPQKPKPPSSSARSMGVTNPLIQAGMFLGYGPDIQNWTPEQHRNAEAHELEKKIAGAINLDRKLYEESLKMFPGDKLAGLNEFIRVLTTRAAGQSYGSALGPTLNAPPVPYPNAQTPPVSGASPRQTGTSPQTQAPSPTTGQPTPAGMSPAETKAFQTARGTAAGTKPSEETKRQVAAGLNVSRMLDDLVKSADIDKYGYAGQRAFEEGRDIAAGYTLGKVKANPDYIKFRQILRQLELGAFDFGGKQLTQTEKDFVMAALPSTWQRNPESMRAAIREFSNRIKYMTGLWSKFASLSGAEYDDLVRSELAKYKGSSAGMTPGAAAPAPATGGWSIKPKGR